MRVVQYRRFYWSVWITGPRCGALIVFCRPIGWDLHLSLADRAYPMHTKATLAFGHYSGKLHSQKICAGTPGKPGTTSHSFEWLQKCPCGFVGGPWWRDLREEIWCPYLLQTDDCYDPFSKQGYSGVTGYSGITPVLHSYRHIRGKGYGGLPWVKPE